MDPTERDELEYIIEAIGPDAITEGTLVSTIVDVYGHDEAEARAVVDEALERDVIEAVDRDQAVYRVADPHQPDRKDAG